MNNYRDLFLANFRSPNSGWGRFRAANRAPLTTTLMRWRGFFAPADERPEVLDSVRRAVPLCLNNVGRTTAQVLDARPTLAREVGISGDELRDLIERREDCTTITALAGQIEHAGVLATGDAAAALSERNERVYEGITLALQDPNLPADERDRLVACIADLNLMQEFATHRQGARERARAQAASSTRQELTDKATDAAAHAALTALGGKTN